MKQSLRTEEFAAWLHGLRDSVARARIAIRIDRLCAGNAGDVKSVGSGVSELRIDYGPGYRVYFAEYRSVVIVLLQGGTKKRQQDDIEEAKRLFADWKKERR
jgi:putative addiction module killer protein